MVATIVCQQSEEPPAFADNLRSMGYTVRQNDCTCGGRSRIVYGSGAYANADPTQTLCLQIQSDRQLTALHLGRRRSRRSGCRQGWYAQELRVEVLDADRLIRW